MGNMFFSIPGTLQIFKNVNVVKLWFFTAYFKR